MTQFNKIALKRIVADVSDMIKNPLEDNGVYYKHDEDTIVDGYALIIGPTETPYSGGIYLFHFIFPNEYPHLPPKVIFCTGDGETRFNPNFYKNGKVCLSVLNTWKGEQWSACQTIRSVLLTLVTTFNSNPLLNEPGIKNTWHDIPKYNEIIFFKNIEIAMYDMIHHKRYKTFFSFFETTIHKIFLNNVDTILEEIRKKIKIYPKTRKLETQLYKMEFKLSYKALEKKIAQLKDDLKKN